jgi:probable F420-dependent oxidoreductase
VTAIELGCVGIRFGFRSSVVTDPDVSVTVDAAQEIEELGFGALWLNADRVLERGEAIADGTNRIAVASSIASIWVYDPAPVTLAFRGFNRRHPGRFLLGVGVSHKPIVEATAPQRVYDKPLASMVSWLDELDACADPVPVGERIVAAISPRMLEVARDRSAGSHPYLVPLSHTREARKALGSEKVLAPAIAVYLGTDAHKARQIGRAHIANPYLGLPNYTRNWLRHDFDESDLAGGGSDRLVDALVAWGDAATLAAKIREQLAAGADHVGLHIIDEEPSAFPREALRELAAALAADLAA